RSYPFTAKNWFAFLGSGQLPMKIQPPKILLVSILIAGLTLLTNQYFHGGVFGKLNNKSVRPKVEISHVQQQGSQLAFRLFRVEGADVYGSLLIGIQVLDENNRVVKSIDQEELAQFPVERIHNHYVAKIKPGSLSLILPLGAKADLTIDLGAITLRDGYRL